MSTTLRNIALTLGLLALAGCGGKSVEELIAQADQHMAGGDYQSAVSSPTELIALAPCARSTPEPPTTPGRFNACRRPQDETWPRVKWVVERTGGATEPRHRDEWSSATPEWVATNSQREASWFVTVPFCCRGVPWEGLLCRAVALCCSG